VGVDRNPLVEPDVLADLDRVPYPFATDAFDEIVLDNVLEHLDDVPAVMTELYRLGRHGAHITIIVPYFRSRWAAVDPTHRHSFTVESMGYFDGTHPFHDRYRYASVDCRVEDIRFNEEYALIGRGAAIGRSLVRYANRHPLRYERWLSSWWPLDTLTFRLRVHKP
jgi:SAM-dependent methyltransferase